ncbi:hypothetical protein [Acinetobacter populi]|uniref:hypothetical protein n=1 Tax=Acinetobacter populi TaxID=1582270 RepID=UPI00148B469A|nr:hypothetical protein [Acinetobacter populi]
MGLEGGLNPYAYAGNNPVMNVDPSGLSFSPMGLMNDFALSNSYGSPSLNLLDYSLNRLADKFISSTTNLNLVATDYNQSNGKISKNNYLLEINPLGKSFLLIGSNLGDGGVGSRSSSSYYRGAKEGNTVSFTPRPNDFKVDLKIGYVKDTHGVSIFNNPSSISSKGFIPYRLDPVSISNQLRIIQRGKDLNHYEITPRPGSNLTPEQYIRLCSGIKCLD